MRYWSGQSKGKGQLMALVGPCGFLDRTHLVVAHLVVLPLLHLCSTDRYGAVQQGESYVPHSISSTALTLVLFSVLALLGDLLFLLVNLDSLSVTHEGLVGELCKAPRRSDGQLHRLQETL